MNMYCAMNNLPTTTAIGPTTTAIGVLRRNPFHRLFVFPGFQALPKHSAEHVLDTMDLKNNFGTFRSGTG